MSVNFGPPLAPTEHEYYPKVLVQAVEVVYEDVQGLNKAEAVKQIVREKMVFLFPLESTESTRFLSAWLPEALNENHEIGLKLGHPVYGVARAAVYRGRVAAEGIAHFHVTPGQFQNGFSLERPHIFVLTRGVEELLKSLHGEEMQITTLSEKDELQLDAQMDHEISTTQ